MQPCLAAVTTLPCSFADDVAHFADAGCRAMEVWLPKLEAHLEKNGVAATRRLLAERELQLVAAAYQGGLLLSQGDERRAHFDHLRRRLDLCQQFEIPTLLVAADYAAAPEATAFERAAVSLTQAAQWAAGSNVRLALEFRSKNAICASLDTALALVQQCAEPTSASTSTCSTTIPVPASSKIWDSCLPNGSSTCNCATWRRAARTSDR